MRAILYLRVSTDEQAESGAGLKAQTDACLALAKREGWETGKLYADEGLSGAMGLDKRPALLEAVSALGAGDVLMVAKRDRLGRDPIVVAMIEASVARAGARIVSAAGEGTENDDPSSVLMRRMIDAFAEYERLIIKARTRAALAAKKSRGERVGQIPYGKRLEAGRLVDDEEEVRHLLWMQTLAHAGHSPRFIAKWLNASRVPTKNSRDRWSPVTVQRLLKREIPNGSQTPAPPRRHQPADPQ